MKTGIGTKTGILLAAFGSGSTQAESALRAVEDHARTRFPGLPVRVAFTSPLMRERLAGQWKKSDSVQKALRKMIFERFERVVVQPLQLVPGIEYGEVRDDVDHVRRELAAEGTASLSDGNAALPDIRLGAPLLDDHADLDAVADALLRTIPPERCSAEPVLFMGHGSRHPSETRYTALAQVVQSRDPRVFLGTMKGVVRFEDILPGLRTVLRESIGDAVGCETNEAAESRRVWLMPLLAAVGRHALEDMAGAAPDSWRSRLAAEGILAVPVLHGLMESPSCIELWLDRLYAALNGNPDGRSE